MFCVAFFFYLLTFKLYLELKKKKKFVRIGILFSLDFIVILGAIKKNTMMGYDKSITVLYTPDFDGQQ